MSSRCTSAIVAVVTSLALVACTDSTAPVADATPLLRGGSGSGGSGGSGGGGSVGQVQTISGQATCDKGSTYAITVRKGFQNRVELLTNVVASPIPTGPAIAPSTLRGTSIGGYTTFTMTHNTSGALLYGRAGGFGYSVPSYTVTETAGGGTLPVGTTPIRFVWSNQQLDGITFQPDLTMIPVYETCTLVLNVVAR